jgi:hypothetical protein
MSDKKEKEFEKRKAGIEADKKSVDESLVRDIEIMDKMVEMARVKDDPELKMLFQAQALTLTELRRVNIETYSTELQMMTLEQLYLNTSRMAEILTSIVNTVAEETPNEIQKLKQTVAGYTPIMKELRKQVRKRSQERKALEREEKISGKRLERLTGVGVVYG